MKTKLKEPDKLAKILTIGLISGIIAAGCNVCYLLLFELITGFSMENHINVLSVTISSIVPSVFVALLYYSLRKMMEVEKAYYTFILIVIVITLISFVGPLSNELPDGAPMPKAFVGLTLPMHIIAPAIYIFMIVRAVPRYKE